MPIRFLSPVLIIAGICCATIVGCASSRNGPFLGQKFDDPPQLSPYSQPLNSGQQQVVPYRGVVPGPTQNSNPYNLFQGPLVLPFGRSGGNPQNPGTLSNGNGGFVPGSGSPQSPSTGEPVYPTPSADPSLPGNGTLGAPDAAQSGPPRTYRDTVPTYPDAADQPAESVPEETIRQRQETEPLTAPTPAQPPAATILPNISPDEPPGRSLTLEVSDPQPVLLEEAAKFEVVIRNPLGDAVENVVIECRFDSGLTFPQLTDRALRQRLGTLGASESRTIDLALTAGKVGLQCVEFTLSADGLDPKELRRCVEVVDPKAVVEPSADATQTAGGVQISLVGPPARNAGGRLECVLSLENLTGHAVSGILATINHDAALVPREVSTGAVQNPGTLTWDLGMLGVDERVQIQVEFSCPSPAEHVCIDAQVSGRDLPTQRQEVCAVIHPRPTLDVAVADSRDPVPVGETTTYLVTVTNRGLDAIGDVRVDVELDGGLEIVSGTHGVSEVSQSSRPADGPRSQTFAVSGPIAPDDVRTLRIDTRGTEIGVGGLRVLVTELATGRRVNVEEPTLINSPLLGLPFGEFARDK